MEPQQYQQPGPVMQETVKKRNGRKIAGIVLLIAPTAMIVVSIALYAVMNLLFNMSTQSTGLFDAQPGIVTALNIVLFLLGGLGMLAWLPCLIVGIVLLATQKK